MRLPDDVIRKVFPWEEFTLARSLVDNGVPDGECEDDLFAGLRADAVDRA
jgi:mycothiol S-conjugate amidase